MRGLWYLSRMVREPSFAHSEIYEYERKMEATVVYEADTVVTLSEALRQELVNWGVEAGKVTVIPNAVDVKKFVPQSSDRELKQKLGLQGKFVVGFIGSLTEYEGLDLLVEAVGKLASSGLSIGLLVVGDGYSRQRLEELAADWGRECVVFVGRVPFAEVNRYYTICDVCAFPRRGYQVCRYVPPLKPLEAMAMEKPVIVSSLPPLLEMVEDGNTGLVCGVDDGESLQSAIARLYKRPSMATALGKKARQWVEENRSWEKIVAKYIAMYGKLDRYP
jgi:glycosyltransferase involved in cell wall biosynthesis